MDLFRSRGAIGVRSAAIELGQNPYQVKRAFVELVVDGLIEYSGNHTYQYVG